MARPNGGTRQAGSVFSCGAAALAPATIGMKLIVGLGNPGRQYEQTPHNVGFHAIDILAARHGGTWGEERRFEALTTDVRIGGNKVTLMKPLTYMNLSGRSVKAWQSKNGGEAGELLVISDDIHLPMGQLRLRASGSHGGQKGLMSIINSMGTLDVPRLRIGIRPTGGDVSDMPSYVLGRVRPADRDAFAQSWHDGADAVEMVVEKDFNTAMNRYNQKK